MMQYVTHYFSRLFNAFGSGWTRFWFTPSDPSTLSLIRLLTGLVVVYLHATLSFDLIALFGPNGLLPAADISPLESDTFSYLNFLSTPADLWSVHLLGLAVLVLFAVGFLTRLTSVLALIVLLSDVHRAPMITSRTESVVALVMLYLCLAPSGSRISLDRILARRSRGASPLGAEATDLSTTATIATRLIQVHLALLVAMMGFSKLTGEVWWTGYGVWWLIARQESRLVDFTWLHATPKIIELWTHAIVLFEMIFPIAIWIPLARPLVLAAAVVIWTSLALLTGEITYAMMMCIASLAFVSPSLVRSCFAAGDEPIGVPT